MTDDSLIQFANLPIQRNVVLAPLTSYKIGGPADYFISAQNKKMLAASVQAARAAGIPYFILGEGANILVTDKGYRGLVIHNQADQLLLNGTLLTAESGAKVANLIQVTAKAGLSGLEHYAGIPSTVGGAVWQNLHFLSPDRSRTVYIAEVIQEADILDGQGRISRVPVDYFKFGYDQSVLHEHPEIIVLSVTFALTPTDSQEITKTITENLAWRAERQPALEQYPSCGSVFKKIDGVGAGRLIEQAGLKGRRVGGAQVSEKHANFIINTGQAMAADVLALVQVVQAEVEQSTGYRLEPEIRIIGER